MTKHTPEPWKIDGDESGMEIVSSTGQVIATIALPMDRSKGYDGCVAEQEANARLIVEAPALLKALTDCGNALIDRLPSGHPDFKLVEAARAVIKKVEGE